MAISPSLMANANPVDMARLEDEGVYLALGNPDT